MHLLIVTLICALRSTSSFLLYPLANRRYGSKLHHSQREHIHSHDRCNFIVSSLSTMLVVGGLSFPGRTFASNIPKSNGANLSKVGTVETLLPLVQLRSILMECATLLDEVEVSPTAGSKTIKVTTKLSTLLDRIPQEESKLKKIFDEYSDTVSYKQRYLDQNAFLVYYTRGFDGPRRPTMEQSNENDRQTLQYGARNDVWVSLEDIISTLNYYSWNTIDPRDEQEALQDMKVSFHTAISAMDSYLDLVPQGQLMEAEKRISAQSSN